MSRFAPKSQEQKQAHTPSVSQKSPAKQSQAGDGLQANLMQLQQAIGNQATGQLMAQLKSSKDEELMRKKAPGSAQLKAAAPVQRKGKMPEDVQAKMESAFQADFSNVSIHEGNKASEVGAIAYAQGNDIHFAQGKFQPSSPSGQELLGHELAHIVQQRQGRVKPTAQANGLPINDDPKLEQEADDMGRKAAQAKMQDEEEL